MPWSGLIAATEFAPGGRYRPQGRRAPQDPPVNTEGQGASPAPDEPLDLAYHAGRFKTDLTRLQAFEGAPDMAAPATAEGDQQLFDFFGNLSMLLLAVRAGDIIRAQAAADALEMEVLVERSAGRRPGVAANRLDDLSALFGAAQSRDQDAARAASLAADPAAPLDDGGAAYETLTQYLDGGAG
jgi:hypothetical protein